MTDPIRQAWERVEFAILSGSQDGWTDARRTEANESRMAVEQAILRDQPDVIGLVAALRAIDGLMVKADGAPSLPEQRRNMMAAWRMARAALVPFTPEEESE